MKWLGQAVLGLGFACALLACNANASVVITGTRVVYPMDQREVTVKLDNDSREASLVQTWIDDGNAEAQPGTLKVPFIITPPIFRMDPRKAQTLRVIFSGDASLPTDRESVFWFNILDIPPKSKVDAGVNQLKFAFRTRIKLFLRPEKLPGKPTDAPAQLTWKIVASPDGKGQALSVSNPTPYYVSFSELQVHSGDHSFKNEIGGMVPPFGTEVLSVPQMSVTEPGAKVHYTAISDVGAALVGDALLGQ